MVSRRRLSHFNDKVAQRNPLVRQFTKGKEYKHVSERLRVGPYNKKNDLKMYFKDFGYSFSLYGPPSRPITYVFVASLQRDADSVHAKCMVATCVKYDCCTNDYCNKSSLLFSSALLAFFVKLVN